MVLLIPALGIYLVLLTALVGATPLKPYDVFVAPCTFLSDPPAQGFKKWSDPATWGGGEIPGVGVPGANVTIPCGVAILLDVPSVTLGLLDIQGMLKFLDSPSLPSLSLSASFVLVEGQLIIGTPQQQFSQKATITLLPNPNGRVDLLFTANAPAEPAYPRNLGHKAFAVAGGQVHLHGLPSNDPSMPVWVKLTQTAKVGDALLVVDKDVSAVWPVGSEIVIASTDFKPDQAEKLTVTGVLPVAGGSKLLLSQPLKYMHYGEPIGISDGFGGFIDETAEVGLLSRNIIITAADEPTPYELEGGHFIVFFTQLPQFIEGVRLFKLGQQGKLGRYSLHFHLCGDQQGKSVVRKNAIISSKQRCIVVHATFGLIVEENVAFDTFGHCFMIEEGGETGNTFVRNLGIRTKAVTKLIPLASNPSTSEETDNTPATFWITNTNNNYIGNVAAGSEDSGFWIELRTAVRGLSASWTRVNNTIPLYSSAVGTFANNTAHSNLAFGFRTYPHGFSPRMNAYQNISSSVWWNSYAPATIGSFNLYKHRFTGALVHDTDHLSLDGFSFADNTWGAQLDPNIEAINIKNARFVGRSKNYGNPVGCSDQYSRDCGPVSGCSFPLKPGQQGRSTGSINWRTPAAGVQFLLPTKSDEETFAQLISSSTFSSFDSSCSPSAGIGVGLHGLNWGNWWNAANALKALRFSPDANRVFLFPKIYTNPDNTRLTNGETASFYALWDLDGSTIGGNLPGYILSNNPSILPPSGPSSPFPACTLKPSWNAYACPGTCYRTFTITYDEPGFSPPTALPDEDGRKRGNVYSYLTLTRTFDGQVVTADGNLHQYGSNRGPQSNRIYTLSLLAGMAYELAIIPPTSNPSFLPPYLSINFEDGGGCGQGISFRIQTPSGAPQWKVLGNSDQVFYSMCAGSTSSPPGVSYSFVCPSSGPQKGQQQLQLQLAGSFPSGVPVTVVRGGADSAPAPCGGAGLCGLVKSGESWQYDATGLERHKALPSGPGFPSPSSPSPHWAQGKAILGEVGWPLPTISTFLPPPSKTRVTYYFQKAFSLKDRTCVTSLTVEALFSDAMALYINGKQALRTAGLPASGSITAATQAAKTVWPYVNGNFVWTKFTIPITTSSPFSLTNGINYVATEVHINPSTSWGILFDLRLAASGPVACKGP